MPQRFNGIQLSCLARREITEDNAYGCGQHEREYDDADMENEGHVKHRSEDGRCGHRQQNAKQASERR